MGFSFFFVFFPIYFFWDFYLKFSVEAAISLSFDSFSMILIEVLENHFLTFFEFLKKNILIVVWNFYLEISVGKLFILNLV